MRSELENRTLWLTRKWKKWDGVLEVDLELIFGIREIGEDVWNNTDNDNSASEQSNVGP